MGVPLIILLPEEGFRWTSRGGQVFLNNDQRDIIAKALNQDCPERVEPPFTAERFAELFQVAVDNIEACRTMIPQVFWTNVRQVVRWTRNSRKLDGKLLYALSLQIIGARYFAMSDGWNMDAEFTNRKGALTQGEKDTFKLRTASTDFTRIVDSFTDKIHELYAKKAPNVREAFVPYWSQTADNEGSAEASFGDDYVPRACIVDVSEEEEEQAVEGAIAEEDRMDVDG
ncbi:hypothetical protein GGR57DRAFT_519344 [Xylariaceae sp. FL1272]|nr:hypothetical protein GGR57DRAFT_519344 [Xylariaceae sp. FL1272]